MLKIVGLVVGLGAITASYMVNQIPTVIRQERLTPLSLVQKHHRIAQGTVCFYPLEVKCIDDVCGETPSSYWEISVNGDTSHYNANSTIRHSDRVLWHYVSSREK